MTIRHLWLIIGWALVLLVIVLSLTENPFELPVQAGDKYSHVLAYFVLTSWFANIYTDSSKRSMFVVGFLLLGVTLEFLQLLTSYRSFEVKDMVAGFAGVALGWILAPPRLPNYLQRTEEFFQYLKQRQK